MLQRLQSEEISPQTEVHSVLDCPATGLIDRHDLGTGSRCNLSAGRRRSQQAVMSSLRSIATKHSLARAEE